MGVDNRNPWEHPEIRLASMAQYVIGYVLSLALLGGALILVMRHGETPVVLLGMVSVLCFLTVVTQLALLFHLDFSETQRWNTLTLMLNVPLLILSVGLTLWMFGQLYSHIMAPSLMLMR